MIVQGEPEDRIEDVFTWQSLVDALAHNKIETFRDLAGWNVLTPTAESLFCLMDIKGIGPVRLRILRKELVRRGLDFKDAEELDQVAGPWWPRLDKS